MKIIKSKRQTIQTISYYQHYLDTRHVNSFMFTGPNTPVGVCRKWLGIGDTRTEYGVHDHLYMTLLFLGRRDRMNGNV